MNEFGGPPRRWHGPVAAALATVGHVCPGHGRRGTNAQRQAPRCAQMMRPSSPLSRVAHTTNVVSLCHPMRSWMPCQAGRGGLVCGRRSRKCRAHITTPHSGVRLAREEHLERVPEMDLHHTFGKLSDLGCQPAWAAHAAAPLERQRYRGNRGPQIACGLSLLISTSMSRFAAREGPLSCECSI